MGYSTVQYSTVQYSAVQYSTVQYSTVQYSTVQCGTVQYSTVQCGTVQNSTVQSFQVWFGWTLEYFGRGKKKKIFDDFNTVRREAGWVPCCPASRSTFSVSGS